MGTTVLNKGFFVVDDFRVVDIIPRVENGFLVDDVDSIHEVDCFTFDEELDALEEAYFKS